MSQFPNEDGLPRVPNRFSSLKRPDPDHIRAYEDQEFEYGRLKWMMNRLKLGSYVKPMIDAWVSKGNLRETRFAAFNDFFPTFPFVFGCSRLRGITVPWGVTSTDYAIHADAYSTEPARFKKFSWVPFVVAYGDLVDAVAAIDGRRVALIFPRNGFLNGMVIHDDDSEKFWSKGLCWVYKDSSGGKLFVQPFSSLVDAIYDDGHGWKPE